LESFGVSDQESVIGERYQDGAVGGQFSRARPSRQKRLGKQRSAGEAEQAAFAALRAGIEEVESAVGGYRSRRDPPEPSTTVDVLSHQPQVQFESACGSRGDNRVSDGGRSESGVPERAILVAAAKQGQRDHESWARRGYRAHRTVNSCLIRHATSPASVIYRGVDGSGAAC
jgi:hypothetical protein